MQFTLSALVASLCATFASPVNQAHTSLAPLIPITPVHNFTFGTWVENLHVRRTGDVLVTLVAPEPAVYQINPQSGEAYLVATIPSTTSVSGIAEGINDIFYVNALNLSLEDLQGQVGSNAIWELDLRGFAPPFHHVHIEPRLAVEVPKARILNGLAAFDTEKGIYFTGDYQGGVIYRIDVTGGTAEVAVENNFTAPGEVGGVNGLQVYHSYLYWTSNEANVFARVPISNDGLLTGPTELILHDFASDDFTFDNSGNAYLVDNTSAIAILREGSSNAEKVASGIANPTAVRFGRTWFDRDVLYVSSRGSGPHENPDSPSIPGRLSKIVMSCGDEQR